MGKKIAHKITSVYKKSARELLSKKVSSNNANNKISKERYISSQERQQSIDELKLI